MKGGYRWSAIFLAAATRQAVAATIAADRLCGHHKPHGFRRGRPPSRVARAPPPTVTARAPATDPPEPRPERARHPTTPAEGSAPDAPPTADGGDAGAHRDPRRPRERGPPSACTRSMPRCGSASTASKCPSTRPPTPRPPPDTRAEHYVDAVRDARNAICPRAVPSRLAESPPTARPAHPAPAGPETAAPIPSIFVPGTGLRGPCGV